MIDDFSKNVIVNILLADEDEESRRDITLQYFHLNNVIAATDNFSPANKLGQGGFGTVHQVN